MFMCKKTGFTPVFFASTREGFRSVSDVKGRGLLPLKAKDQLSLVSMLKTAPCYFPVYSIIAAEELNFRVRDGNGYDFLAMGTDSAILLLSEITRLHPAPARTS